MNAPLSGAPCAEPLFIGADPGSRFCLLHAPDPRRAPRGAILYVHPFAEELNKTRRMAALQARAFAALGFTVLQVDLYGCGDSDGDFADARWELWKRDLASALAWLARRNGSATWLWGLRLGGLLALDVAASAPLPIGGVLLWQPVMSGKAALTQFLRVHMAGQLANDDPESIEGSTGLRRRLAAGSDVEIGGYALSSALALAIDGCDAASLRPPACPVHWFCSGGPASAKLNAAAERIDARWSAGGTSLHLHPIDGIAFWAGTEVAECPALLAATGSVFAS